MAAGVAALFISDSSLCHSPVGEGAFDVTAAMSFVVDGAWAAGSVLGGALDAAREVANEAAMELAMPRCLYTQQR